MAMLSDLAPNIAKSAKMNSKEFITMRSKKESIGVAIILVSTNSVQFKSMIKLSVSPKGLFEFSFHPII